MSAPSSNMAELLRALTSVGIDLSKSDKALLRHTAPIQAVAVRKATHPALDGRQHLWLTEEQAERIRTRDVNPQPKAESYFARIPQEWKDEWKDKEITKNDWCGFEPDQYTKDKDFRAFIRSTHGRFDLIIPHKKFWLYCEQALRWVAEKKFVHDIPRRKQREFALEEFRRGRENPMYWAIKYGYIRDDSYPGGWRKYDASTPQALIFWLSDCNLSAELGKGRQGAITSTRMLRRAIMMMTRHSHEAVMMTDDVETTGNAIMSQKLLSSIQYMIRRNPWMKPSDSPNWKPKGITLTWGSTSKKSEKKTYSSTTTLISSAQGQAANGANVSEADVDEAQNVKTYGSLKREMRPQMLANIDGILRVRRSLWGWGTGNKDHAGGGAFQAEITTTMGRWERGEDTSSFVPLFFDWTCRPGVTEKDYIDGYNFYISGEADGMSGLSKEEQTAAFLSAWPSKFEDMWLASHTTMIPQVQISEALDLIIAHYHSKNLPIKGEFDILYNKSIPMPEGSYLPFAIQDISFRVLDPDHPNAPIKMVSMPERGWLHRYYHGTDPIQSAGGTSAFGGAIWDNVGLIKEDGDQTRYYPYVAAILNWRPLRIEEAYIQNILLGMFYRNDGQKAAKEVVEANAGQDYIRFKTSAPFNLAESLWWRTALPAAYQGGQHIYGVDMKNNATNSRKTSLFRDIQRFHSDFRAGSDGNRGLPPVPFYEYYTQLRDMGVEETKRGAIEFGVMNHKIQRDDLVFAVQYAYMSCITANKRPEKIGTEPKKRTVRKERYDPVTLQHYWVNVTEDVRLPVHG